MYNHELNIKEAEEVWDRLVDTWQQSGMPPSFEVFLELCHRWRAKAPKMLLSDVARAVEQRRWPD